MRNVLITGGTGFIGTRLAERLSAHDCCVTALSRHPAHAPLRNVRYVQGDITDIHSIESCFTACEAVFHCAGFITFLKKDIDRAYEVNVLGTENVLRCAVRSEVSKVVHLSAGAVLGFSKTADGIIDESANPRFDRDNVYAHTKAEAEKKVQECVREKGLDACIANIATVYGEGDFSLNSGALVKAISQDRLRALPPGGTSYVDIRDLTCGLQLLLERGKRGRRYIFSNQNLTYKALAQAVAHVLGKNPRFVIMPKCLGVMTIPAIEVFAPLLERLNLTTNLVNPQILKESFGYKYYSNLRAKTELGWQPESQLMDTLRRAVDFYRETGAL